jgi:HAD superfamily hydrolase (TIGR01509 family)
LKDNPEVMNFLDMMDGGILSYRDRVIKPDAEIYELLRTRYGFEPDRAVFIDDTEKNVRAAEKLGIHGIVFHSLDQMLADLHALGVK